MDSVHSEQCEIAIMPDGLSENLCAAESLIRNLNLQRLQHQVLLKMIIQKLLTWNASSLVWQTTTAAT